MRLKTLAAPIVVFLLVSGWAGAAERDSFEISLLSRSFVPSPGPSAGTRERLEAAGRAVREKGGARVHALLQFDRIPSPAERAALEEAGVRLLSYLPNYAFYASLPAAEPARAASLPSVRWLGGIADADRLSPEIRSGEFGDWAHDTASGKTVVLAKFFADVAQGEASAAVARSGGKTLSWTATINTASVLIHQERIAALAGEDAVEWIEQPLPPLEPVNDRNRARVGADTLFAPPYGLDGSGVDVLVFDAGRVYPHDDLDSRRTWGDSAAFHYHATHVACTICGDGTVNGAYRGMAPAANLLSMAFEYDGTGVFLYTNPGDIEADLYYAKVDWAPSADLLNASIGTNTASYWPCLYEGNYGATDLLLDAIVAGSLGEPFIAAWANGNDRGGRCGGAYHTTAPPACAKNPIQSGATVALDDSISVFSGWGPSDDGRLKPVICSPGVQVASCNSANGYMELSGTSMASPTTAGIIALLLEQYRDAYFAGSTDVEFLPSSAKALLIHTAADLGNAGPDFRFGYGRIDGQAAADEVIARNLGEFSFSATGETRYFTVSLGEGESEIKASLAWDDPPGSLAAEKKLVNDLDLFLIAPDGTVHRPWVLDPLHPGETATTGTDELNNQEQAVVFSPQSGDWTVGVAAARLPQPPQRYSLVFPGAGFVAATPTPSDAPSPSPTPSPGDCHETLVNGGFESGTYPWEWYGSAEITTTCVFAGSYAARLGGSASGTLSQTLIVPVEAADAVLSYAVRLEATSYSYLDSLDVEIRDESGGTLTTLQSLNNFDDAFNGVWTETTFWLGPEYSGRTIQIYLQAEAQSLNNYWCADSFSLRYCYPDGYATPTATSCCASPTPTTTPAAQALPFREDFEDGWINGAPEGWTKEFVSGVREWIPLSGGANGHPASAFYGEFNAMFFGGYDWSTRLITPPLALGACAANPRLSFRLAMEEWEGDQDELAVYCRPGFSAAWTLLTSFTTSLPGWTSVTLLLPDPCDGYAIRFDPTGNYGYGVCLDDVYIACAPSPTATPPPSPTPTPDGYHSPSPTPENYVARLDLDWSTYLGGGLDEMAYDIALDSLGKIFLVGYTTSSDFPTSSPYQTTRAGSSTYSDAFLSILGSDGSSLISSTYLGGTSYDRAYGIALDPTGNALLVGETRSVNFPTVNPYQPSLRRTSYRDAFLASVAPGGSSLLFSTYFGGWGSDYGLGVASRGDGAAWICGYTESTDLPLQSPFQAGYAGGSYDGIVAAFSSSGSLLCSSYLGGAGEDYLNRIAVADGGDSPCLLGRTTSMDFPTIDSYQATLSRVSYDAVVARLASSGSALLFSSYFGGVGSEEGAALAVGPEGEIFLGGYTYSSDFPTLNSWQSSLAGGTVDAFAAVFSSDNTLSFSSYLGGTGDDIGYAAAIDSAGGWLLGGMTSSPDFPLLHPCQSSHAGGEYDCFLSAIPPSGGGLVYSSYLGSSDNDQFRDAGFDPAGGAVLAGITIGADFPTRNPYQPSMAGGQDAIVARLAWSAYYTTPTVSPTPSPHDYTTPSATPTARPTPTGGVTPTPEPAATATPPPTPSPAPSPSPTPSCGPSAALERAAVASGDFDGDGVSDCAIFRPADGLWSIRGLTRFYLGGSDDRATAGDFDGDGTSEAAVFRDASGLWAVSGVTRLYLGQTGDIPSPADFDGDATAEIAVFRGSIGLWAVAGRTQLAFGSAGDWPVPGDYGGDGTAEATVYRPASGLWAVRDFTRSYLGGSDDWPAAGDYAGAGARRIAVFRPCSGLWAVGGLTRVNFGNCLDWPRPADYDGDGTDEIGVFRGSEGFWSVRELSRIYFGSTDDVPVTR